MNHRGSNGGSSSNGGGSKQPKVDPERGMHVLWPDHKQAVEKLTKRHPEPEKKMVIRLTGIASP